MTRMAAALLFLPNGLLVMHRHSQTTEYSPGRIDFFGGQLKDDETPLQGIKRWLQVETTLDIKELKFDLIKEIDLKPNIAHPDEGHLHVFKVDIPTANFGVTEGIVEVHTAQTLWSRIDLTPGLRIILERL